MELFRCLLFLVVDVILSSQNLDTGGKLKRVTWSTFSSLSIEFCENGKGLKISTSYNRCRQLLRLPAVVASVIAEMYK